MGKSRINTRKFADELMGQKVVVYNTVERIKEHDSHTHRVFWVRRTQTEVRSGWIIGLRWLQTGVVHYGTRYSLYEPVEDYTHLEETEARTPCVLVAFWPTAKPVHVPMDGFRLAVDSDKNPYPTNGYGPSGTGRDGMLKEARKWARAWKRDARGRFIRGGCL